MALLSSDPETDLLTKAEAAKLLKVSPVTISRWLKQGRLPAYRLGPRAIRIRRADLDDLLLPTSSVAVRLDGTPPPPSDRQDDWTISTDITAALEPLTDDEVRQALQWLEEAEKLRERIRAENGGNPLTLSWPLIREARDKR